MPRVHSHDNGTHPIVDLCYDKWPNSCSRTAKVEVLDHPHDAPLPVRGDGNRAPQGFFQLQPAHCGLIYYGCFGVGRLVGQGASLDHSQSHDSNEVAICSIQRSAAGGAAPPSPRTQTRYVQGETHSGDTAVLKQLSFESPGLACGQAAVMGVLNDDNLFRLQPQDGVLAEQVLGETDLVPDQQSHRHHRRSNGELRHHQTLAQARAGRGGPRASGQTAEGRPRPMPGRRPPPDRPLSPATLPRRRPR